MRKRRKRHRIGPATDKKDENGEFLDKPFKGLLKDIKVIDREEESALPRTQPDNAEEEEIDQALFEMAMRDVVQLKDKKGKIFEPHLEREPIPDHRPGSGKRPGEEFSSLVKESSAWDISFSDEYMEGAVSGVGPKIMRKLKRGEFSMQDHIDLHGLTKKEAETAVDDFIIQSYHKGLRCVLIVHGRGLRSVNHQPAIKSELPIWFRRGLLKKIVLAFVTAQPCDGGAGASYVLLKKR